MKHAITRLVFTALVLVACAGCTTPAPYKPFIKDPATPVKKIAILPIEEPKEFFILNESSRYSGLGLIGAVADIYERDNKSTQFTELMKSRNILLGGPITQLLATELKKQGYEVLVFPERPQVRDGQKGDYYTELATDADAILDAGIMDIGYRASEGYYKPWLHFLARLMSKRNAQILYLRLFSYGSGYPLDGFENIVSEPKYVYPNFDTLMQKFDEAVAGLKQGSNPIATRIAEQLK